MAITTFEERQIRNPVVKDDLGILFQRLFLIETDAIITDYDTIFDYASTPKIGEAYPSDITSKCTKLSPIRKDNLVYELTVEYRVRDDGQSSSGVPKGSTDNPAVEPWELPKIVDYTTRIYNRPFELGFVNGKGAHTVPVVNSAGEPFNPSLGYDAHVLIIRVTRYSRTYDVSHLKDINKVWGGTFEGVTGNVQNPFKLGAIQATEMYSAKGIKYYRITYEVEFLATGHNYQVKDMGYNEVVNGKYERFKDSAGNDKVRPTPLNGEGAEVPASGTTPGKPKILTFYPYLEIGGFSV